MTSWVQGLAAAAMAVFTTGGTAVADDLPKGWRKATPEEMSRNLDTARREGGATEPRLEVEADFDGDGREDRAVILLNDSMGRFSVFVRRAAIGRYVLLTRGDRLSSLWNYTLDLIGPGVHEPACASGAGGAGPCRNTVQNRWPAVGLTAVESSMSITFWDGRRFVTEFLSD